MIKSTKFRILLVAAATFGFTIISADAQTPDAWLSVRSKNFSIVGNATEIDLRAAAKRLEDFRWAFGQLYPQLRLDNGKPTNIVLFKDAASFNSFLPKRPDGTTDDGVAGYFQPADDVNYITLAAATGQGDPLSTVVHEYVHLILEANFDRAAISPWLNEGLAEYFKNLAIGNDKTIVVGGEQREHLALLRRGGLMPTADIFAVDAPALRTISPQRRRQFYSESWLIVHCLMRNGKFSIGNLSAILPKLRDKNAAAKLQPFGTDLATLENQLHASLEQKPLPTIAETVESVLPVLESPSVDQMPPTQSNAILGDMLFHTGDISRAETLLRQTIEADRGQPLANAALGLLLIRQQKSTEAKAFLKTAIDAGTRNYLVYFNYAYALTRAGARDDAISDISDEDATTIHKALESAIELAPEYVESYRLLALVDFVRDENLDEAIALLQKGLRLHNDDAELKLLLARILLRREDIVSARQIAEQVSASSDAKHKAEADEVIKAAFEYTNAKSAARSNDQLQLNLIRSQDLVVLKRSWLTTADVAQIDEERINNNFNRIILRPRSGEKQIVGRIEQIVCNGSDIKYFVRAADGHLVLKSPDFASVRMTVAKEGESSFEIGCGATLDKNLTVINYQPSLITGGRWSGVLSAISFVPDNFRLKTLYEMSAARMVAIDDDTLRRSGPSAEVNPDTIRRSIQASLRDPHKGEIRAVGHLEKIDCSNGSMLFRFSSKERILTLQANPEKALSVGWFTVASTQLPIQCVAGPSPVTTIITFKPAENAGPVDGELKALEFVPNGFVLP